VSHLDPDQLALLALDEPVATTADRAHLAECPACSAELAEMRHAAEVGRTSIVDGELEAPPERVWQRIADELDLHAATPEAAPPTATPTPTPPSTRKPRRARLLWVLAASLVLLAGIGITAWGLSTTLRPTEIAAASLQAFPDHPGAEGTADVEKARNGTLSLHVTLRSAPKPDSYREVWLIRNDAAALISLGILEDSTGTFPIPEGVDLAEYSLVDVSVEPVDGNPSHSGDSIVRGELRFS
jgi:anti-sigma-K factor RskA